MGARFESLPAQAASGSADPFYAALTNEFRKQKLLFPRGIPRSVSKKRRKVRLVEASPARYTLDLEIGRVVIEPDSIRFHKSGRGRGRVILSADSAC